MITVMKSDLLPEVLGSGVINAADFLSPTKSYVDEIEADEWAGGDIASSRHDDDMISKESEYDIRETRKRSV